MYMSFLEIVGLITIAPIVFYAGIVFFTIIVGIVTSLFSQEERIVRRDEIDTKERLEQ